MKRFDQMRADNRPIEDKAIGLIFAMNDEQALCLLAKLRQMAARPGAGGERAEMFCGSTK